MRRRVLGRREAVRSAVDRRRGGEHDPDAVPGRRLEHTLRREDVPLDVEREDVAEAPHPGLAGKVEDAVEPEEVDLVDGEVDAANVEIACVLLLQPGVVVIGEAVEADHLVPEANELVGEMGADEARCAGDPVTHRRRLPASLRESVDPRHRRSTAKSRE